MLTFQIDTNDEKFKIEDGGCVKDNVATLITKDIKLHHNTDMINFTDAKHHKLILNSKREQSLYDHSTCVMSGEIIDVKNTKDNCKELQISFGGLIGTFNVSNSNLTSDSATEKIYLFIS